MLESEDPNKSEKELDELVILSFKKPSVMASHQCVQTVLQIRRNAFIPNQLSEEDYRVDIHMI